MFTTSTWRAATLSIVSDVSLAVKLVLIGPFRGGLHIPRGLASFYKPFSSSDGFKYWKGEIDLPARLVMLFVIGPYAACTYLLFAPLWLPAICFQHLLWEPLFKNAVPRLWLFLNSRVYQALASNDTNIRIL